MQDHLRHQARLKPAEVMGSFPIEAEDMCEFLIHRLDNPAYPSHPASEPLRPRCPTITLGWTDGLGAIGLPPGLLRGVPLEALIDNV